MFKLPELKYSYNSLEPVIDAKTMEIHHSKHHQAYITNLNTAIDGTQYASWSIDDLMKKIDSIDESIKATVRNNGGGHWNHSLFWTILSPVNTNSNPSNALLKAINNDFGSVDKFKEEFSNAAKTQFGSGWAWLVVTKENKLAVRKTPNQDNPLMNDEKAILGLDVWEHAYYLNYQNRRADYVSEFFKVINWAKVEELYSK